MQTPTELTVGSLFSGYGGLDMAITRALNPTTTRLVFVSDIEPGPTRILAHRHPNVPNLGDITQIDWRQVPHVDVLVGGSPCQSLSLAGRREGMRPGTRSGLWSYQADAIAALHPRLVVWENVAGALNGPASSAYDTIRPNCLKALGRVLGDLANLQYDAMWTVLEAAQVGAPHHRLRVFLTAWPTPTSQSTPTGWWASWDAGLDVWTQGRDLFDEPIIMSGAWPKAGRMTHGTITPCPPCDPALSVGVLLGTPQATDAVAEKRTTMGGSRTTALGTQISLLSTPTSNLGMRGANRVGDGHASLLDTQIIHQVDLLATPQAGDGEHGGPNHRAYGGGLMLSGQACHLQPTVLLKTPRSIDASTHMDAPGSIRHASAGNGTLSEELGVMLPTPTSMDDGNTPATHLARKPGRTRVTSLPIIARHDLFRSGGVMLPTPTSRDGKGDNQRHDHTCLPGALHVMTWDRFGPYAPAVHQWERVMGRVAPDPTVIPDTFLQQLSRLPMGLLNPVQAQRLVRRYGRFHYPFPWLPSPWFQSWARSLTILADPSVWDGRRLLDPSVRVAGFVETGIMPAPVLVDQWDDQWRQYGRARCPSRRQLNPRFVEWMMGLPDQWVTNPEIWTGLSMPGARMLQLRALGNGVVPRQGETAIRWALRQRDA